MTQATSISGCLPTPIFARTEYVGDTWIFTYTLSQPLPDGSGKPDPNNPTDLTGKVLTAELYSVESVAPVALLQSTTDATTDLAHGKFTFVATGGNNGLTQLFLADALSPQSIGPNTARIAIVQTDEAGNIKTFGVQYIRVRKR